MQLFYHDKKNVIWPPKCHFIHFLNLAMAFLANKDDFS